MLTGYLNRAVDMTVQTRFMWGHEVEWFGFVKPDQTAGFAVGTERATSDRLRLPHYYFRICASGSLLHTWTRAQVSWFYSAGIQETLCPRTADLLIQDQHDCFYQCLNTFSQHDQEEILKTNNSVQVLWSLQATKARPLKSVAHGLRYKRPIFTLFLSGMSF